MYLCTYKISYIFLCFFQTFPFSYKVRVPMSIRYIYNILLHGHTCIRKPPRWHYSSIYGNYLFFFNLKIIPKMRCHSPLTVISSSFLFSIPIDRCIRYVENSSTLVWTMFLCAGDSKPTL